jgi:hypothetical protein
MYYVRHQDRPLVRSHEEKRCSNLDTEPESYITEYTSVYED